LIASYRNKSATELKVFKKVIFYMK